MNVDAAHRFAAKKRVLKVALQIPTRLGVFTATYSARGLSELHFPTGHKRAKRNIVEAARSLGVNPDTLRTWHRLTANALQRALAGLIPGRLPPLDLSASTAFQRRVWSALRTIMPGTVRTYGQLARMIGKPSAARAVGGACKANPIPVFIPCHRVIGVGARLGGFSAGLKWKRLLLAREKAPVPG